MSTQSHGRLYVVSAPSGAGKTSLVKALMQREPELRFSVSYTTRAARANVREALTAGKLLLLEIDWQGARQVRASMPAAHSIFILPPTRRALEERLTARSTDSPDVIRRRLKDAQRDIAHWIEFDYVVINDRFEQAVIDFQAIVRDQGDALRGTRPEVARLAVELL